MKGNADADLSTGYLAGMAGHRVVFLSFFFKESGDSGKMRKKSVRVLPNEPFVFDTNLIILF